MRAGSLLARLALTQAVRAGAALLPSVVTRTPGGALTFDDGPHPATTAALLDALGGTRATFFLLADQATAYPSLVRTITAAGHGLGLHGPTHADLWRTRFDARAWDDARAGLADLAGTPVAAVRPPYGHVTPALLRWARARSLPVVLWDVMPGDFLPGATGARLAAIALRQSRPDSIVVLHEGPRGADVVAEAVARLCAARRWAGLSAVTS